MPMGGTRGSNIDQKPSKTQGTEEATAASMRFPHFQLQGQCEKLPNPGENRHQNPGLLGWHGVLTPRKNAQLWEQKIEKNLLTEQVHLWELATYNATQSGFWGQKISKRCLSRV